MARCVISHLRAVHPLQIGWNRLSISASFCPLVLRFWASPKRVCLSVLPTPVTAITVRVFLSLCPCKIIPPSSKPGTATLLTGERWIRDQKSLFLLSFFHTVRLYLLPVPVAQYNATHSHYTWQALSFVRPGVLHFAPPLKPNSSDIFKGKT